jgi:hypothetical protein
MSNTKKKPGRKPLNAGTNLRAYNVMLDDETRQVLQSKPGSMSAAIRAIVKAYGGLGYETVRSDK